MIRYISLITLILFISSCEGDLKMKNVVIENRYAIDVLSNMTVSTELNEDASLQYQNIFNELYIIVIDESKESIDNAIKKNGLEDIYSLDLEGYAKLILDDYEDNEDVGQIQNLKDTTINGLEAKLYQFDAKIEKYDVFYKIAMIKGVSRYYQVLTWTLKENETNFKNKMTNMILSFKEIQKRTIAK